MIELQVSYQAENNIHYQHFIGKKSMSLDEGFRLPVPLGPFFIHIDLCTPSLSYLEYSRVPARWGLQQTTRAPDSDKTWGQGFPGGPLPIKI